MQNLETIKRQATGVQTVKPLDFKSLSSMHNSVMLHTHKKPIRARNFLSKDLKQKQKPKTKGMFAFIFSMQYIPFDEGKRKCNMK